MGDAADELESAIRQNDQGRINVARIRFALAETRFEHIAYTRYGLGPDNNCDTCTLSS